MPEAFFEYDNLSLADNAIEAAFAKNHSKVDDEYLELKERNYKDAVSCLVNSIEYHRNIRDKYPMAAIRVAISMINTKKEVLKTTLYRRDQIQLMFCLQLVKRAGLYRRQKVSNKNTPRKTREMLMSLKPIIQPEHFPRNPEVIQTKSKDSSPWEGTEYKYQLLKSLLCKLVKKSVLLALSFHASLNRIQRRLCQQVGDNQRLFLKKIYFYSLQLYCKSSQLVVFNSNNKAIGYNEYTLKKNGLLRLKERLLLRSQRRAAVSKSTKFHNHYIISKRFRIFYSKYQDIVRVKLQRKWSFITNYRVSIKKAFVAWEYAIIKKHELRRSVVQKYSMTKLPKLTEVAFSINDLSVDFEDNYSKVKDVSLINCSKLLHNYKMSCLSQLDGSLSFVSQVLPVSSEEQNHKTYEARSRRSTESTGREKKVETPTLTVSCEDEFLKHRLLRDLSLRSTLHAKNKSTQSTLISPDKNDFTRLLRESLLSNLVLSSKQLVAPFRSHPTNDDASVMSSPGIPLDMSRSAAMSMSAASPLNASFAMKSQHRSDRNQDVSLLQSIVDLTLEDIQADSIPLAAVRNNPSETSSQAGKRFCEFSNDESDFESKPIDVKRQLIEATRDRFRQIKIHWLVSACRRFLRQLHRNSLHAKAKARVQKFVHRKSLSLHFRTWTIVFSKIVRQYELCHRIYSSKLHRAVFYAWKELGFERLEPRRNHIENVVRRNIFKTSLRKWFRLCQQLIQEKSYFSRMENCIKRSYFLAWQRSHFVSRRYRSASQTIVKHRLKPLFVQWSKKYNQKTLLRRVFALYDVAWHNRLLNSKNDFLLKCECFESWVSFMTERKNKRRDERQWLMALYFRGASLLARYFVIWSSKIRQKNRIDKVIKSKNEKQMKFALNCLIFYLQRQFRDETIIVRRMSKKRTFSLFHKWRLKFLLRTKVIPTQQQRLFKLRRSIQSWKVLPAVNALETIIIPKMNYRSINKAFKSWRYILSSRRRMIYACNKIENVKNKVKLRQMFLRWPGRDLILKLRVFKEKVALANRVTRVKLVDARTIDAKLDTKPALYQLSSPLDECPEETIAQASIYEKSAIMERRAKSFVRKKPSSILECAVLLGFISNGDEIGLNYLHELLGTVFFHWQMFITRIRNIRMREVKVRSAVRRGLLQSVIRNWIESTPVVSHRLVTWVNKPKLTSWM